jgi:hypothetical protein
MIRRLKKEVLSQLPSKMRQRVPLALDPAQVPSLHLPRRRSFSAVA